MTSTHFVLSEVVTVSVSDAPAFAYSTPFADTVPSPPEKDAEPIVEPNAPAATTASSDAAAASTPNRPIHVLRGGLVPRIFELMEAATVLGPRGRPE